MNVEKKSIHYIQEFDELKDDWEDLENGIDMTFLRIFEDKFTDESVVHTVESLPDDFDCAIFFVGDNYGTDCETSVGEETDAIVRYRTREDRETEKGKNSGEKASSTRT